jgi:hypothetical protein
MIMISTIQHNSKAAARFGFLKNMMAGLLLLAVQQIQAQGTIPMQKGMAAVTCFSGPGNGQDMQNPNGPVLAIFDIRDPQANGAPTNPPANWTAASTGAYHPANWTAANMGELFGVSIEEGATSPAIFATTTGITGRTDMNLFPKTGGTGGEVFRVNGTTGAVTTLVTLPNTTYTVFGIFSRYVGLGDNTYNRINNVLYVSNMDNGLVYAVNATTGALLGTPFNHNTATADNTALPFTQDERIVYGLGYNEQENKLYYSVKGGNALDANSQVYTVGLNADGSINAASKSPSPVVSYSTAGAFSMISDIAFSADGTQMLLAEMRLNRFSDILVKAAHNAKVYKYVTSAGTWSLNLSYAGQIGSTDNLSGNNAAGGVDFGFNNYGTNSTGTNLDDAAVMTGDALIFGPNIYVYGIQISNIVAPNTFASAYIVDLDGNTGPLSASGKFTTGDIEVYGDVLCTPPTLSVINGVTCAANSINLGTLVTNSGGTLTYHATLADAQAGTPTISPVVSPSVATTYYVRSTAGPGCFATAAINISIAQANCFPLSIIKN